MKKKIICIFIVIGLFSCCGFASTEQITNEEPKKINVDKITQNNVDNPPVLIIESPLDGTMFCDPAITVEITATDDHGVGVDRIDHQTTTGTHAMFLSWALPLPLHISMTPNFTLEEGWNKITVYAFDEAGHTVSKSITIYYYELDVVSVTGFIGVSAVIRNNGGVTVANIPWSIDITGLIWFGDHASGSISSLSGGGQTIIFNYLVLGFGFGTIVINAGCASKTVNCFLLGPFVFVL